MRVGVSKRTRRVAVSGRRRARKPRAGPAFDIEETVDLCVAAAPRTGVVAAPRTGVACGTALHYLGGRLGLPRSPEPFHRVYSPPEAPPGKTRRPATAGVVTAAVAVLLALIAVALFGRGVFSSDSHRHRAGTAIGSATPRPTGRSVSTGPQLFTAIPTACSILPPATVRRLVPTASPTVDKMGGEAASTCEFYLSRGGLFRAVQVAVRAFLPQNQNGQAAQMTAWSFDAQWKQAQQDATSQTSGLRRITGLGDDAFERYWIDPTAGEAVGETTVRYRNVVLTVQYTEQQPPAQDRVGSRQRCLANAEEAAREGLASFR